MKFWIVTLLGLASTWHFMDMASESRFYSGVLPVLFFGFLIIGTVKLAIKLGSSDGSGGFMGDAGYWGNDSGGGSDGGGGGGD